jgi:hypothetical protein
VLCSLFLLSFALIAPLAVVAAEDEVTLEGMLSRNEAGRFALVEEESGNSILLETNDPQKLLENEGQRVKVTGRWSASRETFFVTAVSAVAVETPVQPPPG